MYIYIAEGLCCTAVSVVQYILRGEDQTGANAFVVYSHEEVASPVYISSSQLYNFYFFNMDR